jgi:hypothetical protein
MASNADRAWQAHSLGSTEDRLYPSGTVNGEAKIMFKWMSAFALAMLACAPALADETEYSRPGHYQYYYQYRFSLPPEQHVIEVVQPPYSGNFIINGTRFTARTPACFSWAAGERIRLISGDWNGRCVAALFYNFYRRNTCEVWCGGGGWW